MYVVYELIWQKKNLKGNDNKIKNCRQKKSLEY